MEDFFEKEQISKETIDTLNEIYPEATLFDLKCNNIGSIKNTEYLKSLGINVIEELLIERIDIFIMSLDRLKQYFNNCKEEDIVNLIIQVI